MTWRNMNKKFNYVDIYTNGILVRILINKFMNIT